MKKFIVSSQVLRDYLELYYESLSRYDVIEFRVINGRLTLGGVPDILHVESNDLLEGELTFRQIKRLYRLLNHVQHQPIVIYLENRSLFIQNIML